MKKLLLFGMLIFIVSVCFSQHTVCLKTGEKIDCTVKSFDKGILSVDLKNNILTFKQDDIESVWFTKVKQSNENNKAEIKGVVSYFFNNNYGDKPDVGAQIFIRHADTSKGKSILYYYKQVRPCKWLVDNNKAEKNSTCYKTLSDFNANTEDGYKEFNLKVLDELFGLEKYDNIINIVADGNGNYSTKIDPGLYEIIIVSKGRKGGSIAEAGGKIDQKYFSVKDGDTKVINSRFDMY